MASIDLGVGYDDIKNKVEASKQYTSLKNKYDKLTSKKVESFENFKGDVTQSLDNAKEDVKRFQKKIKSQFDQLLDITKITGGENSQTISYAKKTLLQAVRNVEPKLKQIILDESIKAVGCDLQQTYTPQTLYVKVKSTDILNILKLDPEDSKGAIFYEKNPINIQDNPFSMNRELYQLIQDGNEYSVLNGSLYRGRSGQGLMDIQYVEFNNVGVSGPWFKITLPNRVNNINKVGEFFADYYGSIKVVDTTNIMASIMESLSGFASIGLDVGTNEIEDATKFELIIQRVLGLCFDNRKEIDVSGIAKLSELSDIDESFFEFTDLDLRFIESRIQNIKNGVVEFEGCGNVKVPVDFNSIFNSLNNLNFVEGADLNELSDELTDNLINNELLMGLNIDVKATVNFNFIKLIAQGIVGGLLTPKVLLPIYIMTKSLGQTVDESVKSAVDFIKNFPKFFAEVVSKVGAIFVEELFNIIKRDIQNLIESIVIDLAQELIAKKTAMILKLIQLILIIASFIKDWRRCKSVVDEILGLLNLVGGLIPGGNIPLPLLFVSQLLGGYSETRAFIGTIEELQKLGIPTGDLPDGSPNLSVLAMFGQMKAMAKEESENNKVQIAVGPLVVSPAGFTIPANAFGKKV
jgi:hypothetical protein